MIAPVALASIAAGADGLIVETHPNPAEALSDGPQSLPPEQFTAMVRAASAIAAVLDRPLVEVGKPDG